MHKCAPTCGACNKDGYEQGDIDFLKSHATKESVFFDIGAHAGLYTLQLAPLVKQVIAVEPVTIFTLLRNTVDLDNVMLIEAAAWNVATTIGMECRENGQSFMGGAGDVPCVPLDIFNGARRVLFKIDVEGAVVEVLKGMQYLLARTSEIAGVIEVDANHMTRFNSNPTQIDAHLQGLECVSGEHKNKHYTKGI